MPDETTTAWAVPQAAASARSSSPTFGPIVSMPLATTSADGGQLGLADVGPGEPDRLAAAHAGAAGLARYHAIVRSSPSSSSTFASKPSSSRAFVAFGMRSSTST